MTFKGKRVFVSGGNGVIGNYLINELQRRDAIIYVGDIKPRPPYWDKSIIYRQGDLNYITKEELDDFAPEFFFHLAATFERSIETYEFWRENFHHNVRLSHHLMSLLKDSVDLKKVIFASSYLIYASYLYSFDKPARKAARLKEDDPISPRNLTGAAKLYHEIELRFLDEFRNDRFQFVAARIFRSYGKKSIDIISRWIRALLSGETLTVYAKEGMFDYIYAEDVAEGLVRLALNPDTTGIINLGNDNARRIEEVLEILKIYFPEMNIIEKEAEISYEASQANMDNFKKLVGWQPQRQLEDTIPEMIAFEKEHPLEDDKQISFNTLITSISRKVPLIHAVRFAANKIGKNIKVLGGDTDSSCIGKYFVDEFWHMPAISSLSLEDFMTYCGRNNIRCVIPTRDGELAFFAQFKEQLSENGIHVMVSHPESVKGCIDKLVFYEKTKGLGFPAIMTSTNIEDICCQQFVVKERFGAGSISIGIGLNKQNAITHASTLQLPIFQPFIKGTEVSVDLYISKNGVAKGVVARRRDIIIKGESQVTSTFRDENLENLCSDFVASFNLYGHVILQILIDEKGDYHIIECNSRFGGASTLSIAAGLDSFYWFLLESNGADIAEYPFMRSKAEKIQVRYPEDRVINDSRI
ncbi:MAG: NAD-dependent epimerase/dehydratase family protein [Thermodesulfovibrionales bacterium]